MMTMERTERDDLLSCWYDLFKDVNNFKPRGWNTDDWTIDDINREIDTLSRQLQQQEARKRVKQAAAVVKLEDDIQKLINMGAADRATALRWLIDDEHDLGYIEYERRLPYGHIAKLLADS